MSNTEKRKLIVSIRKRISYESECNANTIHIAMQIRDVITESNSISQIYKNHDSDNQKWYVVKLEDGTYHFTNIKSFMIILYFLR